MDRTILIIKFILFTPHLFAFKASKNKHQIIKDVSTMMCHLGFSYKGVWALLWLLVNDRYFRTLFYDRIGKVSALMRWYTPGEQTFIICCKSIGAGMYLAHPYATILYAKSIGENFSVRQCTTIGNKSDGHSEQKPVIGNNVTLGANVVVIGDIKIGDNVIIGAGSVVVTDIPSNSVAVGNPARVIKEFD